VPRYQGDRSLGTGFGKVKAGVSGFKANRLFITRCFTASINLSVTYNTTFKQSDCKGFLSLRLVLKRATAVKFEKVVVAKENK
jgi:hypothetical protein